MIRKKFGHIPDKRFGHFARNQIVRLKDQLLLEKYSGATGAWSMRLLTGTYSGSCIRVRRSSDNAEQDVGFDATGWMDESSLASFIGANSGFIVTWYDQSGNGNNLTQGTTANQPRIVNAGTIDVIGNYPVIVFDGSNDSLAAASAIITTPPFILNQVCAPSIGTLNVVTNIIGISDTATSNNAYQIVSLNTATNIGQPRIAIQDTVFKSVVPDSAASLNTLFNMMAIYQEDIAGSMNFYARSGGAKSMIESNVPPSSIDNFTVGSLVRSTTSYFQGKVCEVILWPYLVETEDEEYIMQDQIDNFEL